ncbi:MAG: nucleotide exchange factor GrpE [Desulfotalea sp.]
MTEKVKKEDVVEEAVEETLETEEKAEEQVEAAKAVVDEAPVEKTLEEQLADAKVEADELRDSMLRMAAESENFKKRIERERSSTLKYAGEHIFKELLPVADNLERAVTQGIVESVSVEKNLEALKEGVELTLKSLITSLEKFEVKAIDSLGQPFDPKTQEALTMAPSEDLPPNHVVQEYEKGYFFKDRLLRAAKVVVSAS